VDDGLVAERLAELRELQDAITARRRDELIGAVLDVLVDEPGVARGHREAPEIDGIVHVPESLDAGTFEQVRIVDAFGPDLVAQGAQRAR
jgi:tRNA A37 methylthiotransferase MiaB